MSFSLKRFITSVQRDCDEQTTRALAGAARQILPDMPPQHRAAMLGRLVEQLEDRVGAETADRVMRRCHCCSDAMIQQVRRLLQGSQTLQDKLDTLNAHNIGGGQMRHDDNVLLVTYSQCYCPAVQGAEEPLSRLWCSCSVGWLERLLHEVSGFPVQVRLLQSIVQGADTCEFLIEILNEGDTDEEE